jgi:hypothetical protein
VRGWLSNFSGRIAEAVSDALRRRTIFFGADARSLAESSSLAPFALILLVGREHYQEKWLPIPSGSWFESLKLGLLQREVGDQTVAALAESTDGSRHLIVYRIKPESASRFPSALLWLPESFVLGHALAADEVLEVTRDGLGFFVSPVGASQIKGGLLQSTERYAHAVGLPETIRPQALTDESIRDFLWVGLRSLRYRDVVLFLKPDAVHGFIRRLKPAMLLMMLILISYWGGVSAYLEGMIRLRSAQIESLGAQVETLIELDRSNDRLAEERKALLQIDSANAGFLSVWEVVGAVWKLGGSVDNVKRVADVVTISGSVPVATDVVVAVSALPGVSGVKFVSPVVQGGRGEIFAIQYTMVRK